MTSETITITFKSAPSIGSEVRLRALDLTKVDLSLVERDLNSTDVAVKEGKITEADAYKQLTTLFGSKSLVHPEWGLLSGRLEIAYSCRNVASSFSAATKAMKSILHEDYYKFVMEHSQELDLIPITHRDYTFDLFAACTLVKSYLARLRDGNTTHIIETPQYMYLRVATYLWYPNMDRIERMYDDISKGNYSQASPTMFNAGMKRPQLSSCFLLGISDNMSSIAKSWHDCAVISMNSGGIGCDYSALRHSEVGQQGYSRGVIQWLKIKNEVLNAVDQCGKRKGSGTMYLCVWHVDIEEFIDCRKANGPDDMRARELFYALWVQDLFMKRIMNDEMWTLFCPNKAKGLVDKWGKDFEMAYLSYEEKGIGARKVRARELWQKIVLTQIETGMPFLMFGDACNRKSNQKNLGTLRCSNLCLEILEYVSEKDISSCTLSSIALNSCVQTEEGRTYFNFNKLERLAGDCVRNLNQIIDRNFYPDDVPEIRYTNFRNRPLGIGVQGLADTFALLDIAWETEEARTLNSYIFETLYYACVRESVEMAKEYGAYETFHGSPSSKGLFQFDLWDMEKKEKLLVNLDNTIDNLQNYKHLEPVGGRYSQQRWEELRQDMKKYGMRNSLLVALMPTASSAHILGNNESFEAFNELVYARTVLSGQFIVINKHLVRDLEEIDMWNTETLKSIISTSSIAGLKVGTSDPKYNRIEHLKKKYKTAFEIPQKTMVQYALDRGRYVCQTQSMNIFMKTPTYTTLTACHFYSWLGGAKTGMYYLRSKPQSDPINFALESVSVPVKKRNDVICKTEICLACQA